MKNPVAEIGALLKGSDTIYQVDAVTSLGGMEIHMDAWGIDALCSGTQKCLLPMLNSVKVPEGVDEAAVRSTLLKEYKIEIGAGLGATGRENLAYRAHGAYGQTGEYHPFIGGPESHSLLTVLA